MSSSYLFVEKIFQHFVSCNPDKVAYGFIRDDHSSEHLTYHQLEDKIRRIVTLLDSRVQRGQVVMLSFMSGLEFISTFLACLAAGVIAVPVPKGQPQKRSWLRFQKIIETCNPSMILMDSKSYQEAKKNTHFPYIDITQTIDFEDLSMVAPTLEINTSFKEHDVAYLQYTSGSTDYPKGVKVTHENISHNQLLMQQFCKTHDKSIVVSWLPYFHDLGLVGQLLHSIYFGATCYFMDPLTFIQNPYKWMEALTIYKGTISFAPNFAYDLCVKRIPDDRLHQLDLKNWEVALNGAEAVRKETLDNFVKKFGVCGFQKEALCPAYGLAEATLVVSATPYKKDFYSIDISKNSFEKGFISMPTDEVDKVSYVSCGHIFGEQDVLIVDPITCEEKLAGSVGEIWVKGLSVAKGYWQLEKETEETFNGCTQSGKQGYLRTGDLGFFWNNELYIAGRHKDLIIIHGENYYPHDIEHLIEDENVSFKNAGCCVFGVEDFGVEKIVVVQELERAAIREKRFKELADLICRKLHESYMISPHDVVFIKPMHLPKTTSGKVQRQECKKLYQQEKLEKLYSSRVRENSTKQNNVGQLVDWINNSLVSSYSSTLADERRCFTPNVWADMRNRGLFGLEISCQYGGLGFTLLEAAKIYQACAQHDLTLSLLVVLSNTLAAIPIKEYGSDEQKTKYLNDIANGNKLVSFALTEECAGSNPQAIQCSAQQTNEGWVLNGNKIWIGLAAWADVITVFARCYDKDNSFLGIGAFLVEGDNTGLKQGLEAPTMGMKAIIQNEFILENAYVDSSALLGTPQLGMDIAKEAMEHTRLAIGAMSVGAAKQAFSLMYPHVQERVISTGKMVDNTNVQRMLSDSVHSLYVLEDLVQSIVSIKDSNVAIPSEISAIVKIIGAEFSWKVIDSSLQLLGGRGYIETNKIAQLMRDARVLRIFEGPTETLLHYVGSSLCHSPEKMMNFVRDHFSQEGNHDFLKRLEHLVSHYKGSTDSSVLCQLGYCVALLVAELTLQNSRDTKTKKWVSSMYQDCQEKIDEASVSFSKEFLEHELSQYVQQKANKISLKIESTISSYNNNRNKDKEISQEIVGIFKKTILSPQFSMETTFSDLGVNSIVAADLALQLSHYYNCQITPTVFWEYTTPHALVRHLENISEKKETTLSADVKARLLRRLSIHASR